MKHRWMDVVKRSKDALSSSPRSDTSRSPAHSLPPQHRQSLAPSPSQRSLNANASSSAHTLIPRSQSMIDVISATLRSNDSTSDFAPDDIENPAFLHFVDRCKSVDSSACSVANVLEQCVLQGGVHHTYMNVLTYMGSPLRADTCCYCVSVQWFRAFGGHDDFQVIPGACDEYFTATADDIGARILAKVMFEDTDVVKTKMLEYGPIKEDPEVRSKVEMYIERKSVLFMGLQSISVRDGDEYPSDVELRESWTLLIDDRRVRLTCESSLIPPFEALYTSDLEVEVVRSAPNEFCLHLAARCAVHLRAESNVVRDIIVLTVRAFRSGAMATDAVALAPVLAVRSSPVGAHTPAEDFVPAPTYDLPWHRNASDSDAAPDALASTASNLSPVGRHQRTRSTSFAGTGNSSASNSSSSGSSGPHSSPIAAPIAPDDELDDSLLLDAEALIGNALKMGIQHHVLPRAPKRISIRDIADLEIVDALDTTTTASPSDVLRPREPSTSSSNADTASTTSRRTSSSCSSNATASVNGPPAAIPEMLDDPLRDLARADAMDALRTQYTATFIALQRALSDATQRNVVLSQQLDDSREQNAAYERDIATLQSALSAVRAADKVNAMAVDDLAQLVQTATPRSSTSSSEAKATAATTAAKQPENYY